MSWLTHVAVCTGWVSRLWKDSFSWSDGAHSWQGIAGRHLEGSWRNSIDSELAESFLAYTHATVHCLILLSQLWDCAELIPVHHTLHGAAHEQQATLGLLEDSTLTASQLECLYHVIMPPCTHHCHAELLHMPWHCTLHGAMHERCQVTKSCICTISVCCCVTHCKCSQGYHGSSVMSCVSMMFSLSQLFCQTWPFIILTKAMQLCAWNAHRRLSHAHPKLMMGIAWHQATLHLLSSLLQQLL